MKRFTVMLPESVIIQTKRARYSPSKKRAIIEALIKEAFYQLEELEYPDTIQINMNISYYERIKK